MSKEINSLDTHLATNLIYSASFAPMHILTSPRRDRARGWRWGGGWAWIHLLISERLANNWPKLLNEISSSLSRSNFFISSDKNGSSCEGLNNHFIRQWTFFDKIILSHEIAPWSYKPFCLKKFILQFVSRRIYKLKQLLN